MFSQLMTSNGHQNKYYFDILNTTAVKIDLATEPWPLSKCHCAVGQQTALSVTLTENLQPSVKGIYDRGDSTVSSHRRSWCMGAFSEALHWVADTIVCWYSPSITEGYVVRDMFTCVAKGYGWGDLELKLSRLWQRAWNAHESGLVWRHQQHLLFPLNWKHRLQTCRLQFSPIFVGLSRSKYRLQLDKMWSKKHIKLYLILCCECFWIVLSCNGNCL